MDLEDGLRKFMLENDIIVYRNDKYSDELAEKLYKFLSTSVVPNGILGKKANVAITIPKESVGVYIELLANDMYKKKREFLINKYSNIELLSVIDGLRIFELR